MLCRHLEDNIKEYMGFLISVHTPQKEEPFITEYLTEIENVKKDGYWSSKVAGCLPIALYNVTGFLVKIYTSKPEQPVINIQPTLRQSTTSDIILLAYTLVQQISEHYDACERFPETNSEVQDTPDTSANKRFEYSACPLSTSPIAGSSIQEEIISPKKPAQFITPVKNKLFR